MDQISPQLIQRLHLTSTALNQDSAVATRAADGEGCLLHASKKTLKTPGREQLKWALHIDSLVSFALAFLSQLLRKIQFLHSSSLCCPGRALAAAHIFTNKYRSAVLTVGGALQPL